jgi:hypothetical protein
MPDGKERRADPVPQPPQFVMEFDIVRKRQRRAPRALGEHGPRVTADVRNGKRATIA